MIGPHPKVPWVGLQGPMESSDHILGNKAKNLKGVSLLEGLKTPQGLAILPQFSADVLNSLGTTLQKILESNLDPGDAATEIEELLLSGPTHHSKDLDIWWESTYPSLFGHSDTPTFAVRSSGHPVVNGVPLAEDSSTMSMAGQYTSLLDVEPGLVPHAYWRCVASLFNGRSLRLFSVRKDLSYLRSEMTVLIQEMIHGDRSGVMMTIDPVEKNDRFLGVEGGCGPCERYVDGSTQGHFYLVDKLDGRIVESELSRSLECRHRDSASSCFAEHEVLRIAKMGLLIEGYFSGPQDVEFTLTSGDDLYVLQTRPITT